jgi:20S proteasome alpha/beta subunit
VTVCIAARAGNFIVLASDRMVTQDNVQFEPARQKIVPLTNSIFVMTSGDASLSTRLVSALYRRIAKHVEDNPDDWLPVATAVDWYVEEFNRFRKVDAEASVLAPLGLTMEGFLNRQVSFDAKFVERLTDSLYARRLPECEVIIAGRDVSGVHIYTVAGSETDLHNAVGFTAIGVGARHAMSHLMQVRHSWNADLTDTVVRAFVAKRRAEAAPGVGSSTDMVIIGEALGQNIAIRDEVIGRLDAEYEKMIEAENSAEETARASIRDYITNVGANSPDQQLADQSQSEGPLEDLDVADIQPSSD